MDRQGQILMPPDYRHGGIINKGYQNFVSFIFFGHQSTLDFLAKCFFIEEKYKKKLETKRMEKEKYKKN